MLPFFLECLQSSGGWGLGKSCTYISVKANLMMCHGERCTGLRRERFSVGLLESNIPSYPPVHVFVHTRTHPFTDNKRKYKGTELSNSRLHCRSDTLRSFKDPSL